MNRTIFILFGITVVGILLQIFNLSPFTVYPDSWQNLIVAQNIKTYGSVVGFLGKNGMLYPDFFMWTRPLFPLLINAISFIGVNPLLAGRGIAFVLGILSIPMAYLLSKAVFKNKNAGLIAAFFLALLYNHAVWSGLLMTEAIGVFFMLLFLWRFFETIEKDPKFLDIQNILTGFLFALAVLARYEYVIIALPLIVYAFKRSSKPLIYVSTVFVTFFIVTLLTVLWLFPVNSVVQVIINQQSILLTKIAIVVGIILLCYLVFKILDKRYRSWFFSKLPNALSILLGILFLLFLPLFVFNSNNYLFGLDVSIFKNFFEHDLLISFFAFIGLLKMLEDKKQQYLAYFVLTTVVFLGFIYYQINPGMERYMTHLIPFLVIPAVYGIQVFYQSAFINQTDGMKQFLKGLVIFFVIVQIAMTAQGLRNLNDQSWYKTSYEQKAASLTFQKITNKPLLIVSSPEPYYYFTKLDTQSIAESSPFLYLPPLSDKQQIVIVEDMGMHVYFPQFANVLDTKLKKYETSAFYVHERFHSGDQSMDEKYPVVLYTISWEKLKHLVK